MIYFSSQVDKIVRVKDEQIDILKADNVYLKEMLEIEKKRAQNAVDQLLARSGSATITPVQTSTDRFTEMFDKVSTGLALVGGEIGEEEEFNASNQ